LITSNKSLTNHPKWNKRSILKSPEFRKFDSAPCFIWHEQYSGWKIKSKSKSKIKSDSTEIRHIRELVLYKANQIPQSMGLKWQFHFINSALVSRQISKKIWPRNILKYVQDNLYSTTQKFIWHSSAKAQMHIWPIIHMNPDEGHDEHNNILKYFFLPRSSSESWWAPGHVAQDYWSLSNSYKGSRNSINRDQGLNITYTFAKHTRKQPKSVWCFSKNIDLTKIPRSL